MMNDGRNDEIGRDTMSMKMSFGSMAKRRSFKKSQMQNEFTIWKNARLVSGRR